MGIYVITAIVLVICLVLSWFTGTLLQLHGSSLWLLRGSLSILCIAGAAFFLWFHHKVKRDEEGSELNPAVGSELDVLLREADRKLKSSRSAAAGISSLPVIFLVGESGAAKTSTILHSG